MGTTCSSSTSSPPNHLPHSKTFPSFHLPNSSSPLLPYSHLPKGELHFPSINICHSLLRNSYTSIGGYSPYELFISLLETKSSPQQQQQQQQPIKIKLFLCNNKSSNIFTYFGETEYLTASTKHYGVTFQFDYFYEREQVFAFHLLTTNNDVIATTQLTVMNIITTKHLTTKIPITSVTDSNDNEHITHTLILQCKPITTNTLKCCCVLNMSITLKYLNMNRYAELYIVISNINDDRNWRRVYKSNEYCGKVNETVQLDAIRLNVNQLANVSSNNILISIYIASSIKPLSERYVTLNDLRKSGDDDVTVNLNDKTRSIGVLCIKYKEIHSYTFKELINHKEMVMNFVIAIDFTLSNGKQSERQSLHYLRKNELTKYEKAITSCIHVHNNCNRTNSSNNSNSSVFYVFGFGAKLPTEIDVNHCFCLNMKDKPGIKGIKNVLYYYRKAVSVVELSGPTCFAPLLRKMKALIEDDESERNCYWVLMVLTDGNVCDWDDCEGLIEEYEGLPVSVVVVGVGKGSGNEERMVNKKGKGSERKCLGFVEFEEVERNEGGLEEEMLRIIPKQVEEYWRLKVEEKEGE